MSWFKRDKEKDRFYLLPGMGGRSLRRKNMVFLIWALVAGLAVASLLAVGLYMVNVSR